MFNRVTIVLQLHIHVCSPNFAVECRYSKTSLPLPRCYRIIFTVPAVLRNDRFLTDIFAAFYTAQYFYMFAIKLLTAVVCEGICGIL